MASLIDLEIPEQPIPLEELLEVISIMEFTHFPCPFISHVIKFFNWAFGRDIRIFSIKFHKDWIWWQWLANG
jgi:hypothetical protein